jgi:hypothetical protein
VLSPAIEDGHVTLGTMPASARYYPDEPIPSPYLITSLTDVWEAVEEIKHAFKKKQFGPYGGRAPETIGIDSASFLSELLEAHYKSKLSAQISKNKYLLFDKIKDTFQLLQNELHSIPVHVVWTALERYDMEECEWGPQIAGRTRKMLPPSCTLYMHLEVLEQEVKYRKPNGKVGTRRELVRQLRTRPHGDYVAGHRLHEGLPSIIAPTFKAIEACIREAK